MPKRSSKPKAAPKRVSSQWMRAVRLVLLLVVLGVAFYVSRQGQQGQNNVAQPNAPAERYIVKDAVVRVEEDDRIVTRRGEVDVSDTVARIRANRRIDGWEHDGGPFGNHEKLLPQRPGGYYREWVHPTPEASGPGPQRIVSGKYGDLWYTPDHYETFKKVERSKN